MSLNRIVGGEVPRFKIAPLFSFLTLNTNWLNACGRLSLSRKPARIATSKGSN
jgi:hypothetical protein